MPQNSTNDNLTLVEICPGAMMEQAITQTNVDHWAPPGIMML